MPLRTGKGTGTEIREWGRILCFSMGGVPSIASLQSGSPDANGYFFFFFLQNEVPLEVGDTARFVILVTLCLQMIGLEDTEGRAGEKRKPGTRTKEKGGHQEEKESLGLDTQRPLIGVEQDHEDPQREQQGGSFRRKEKGNTAISGTVPFSDRQHYVCQFPFFNFFPEK